MSQYKKRAKLSSESSDREGEPWNQSTRAEKSRHAAKMRRDKEGVEIVALAKLLPFPEEITTKLDKGSIIRLTTSYLRMKKFTQKEGDALLDELKLKQPKAITAGESECKVVAQRKVEEGALMLESLNGFVIFISRKGRVLYVADNVVKHLGIPQHDMIGNNIVEFIHPDDQKELAKQFIVKRPGQQSYSGYGVTDSGDSPLSMEVHFFDESEKGKGSSVIDYIQERSFFMRMRSVTPKKGTGGKGKVIGYRLVQCSGRLKLKSSSNSKGYNVEGLICICRPAQPSPILEIRMDGNMFMSRHNLDMSFTFCDPRIITLVGYEPHELIGKTAYQFHNPLDVGKISSCHSNLIVKGTSVSKYYRFLGKNSDWIWMQTRATIIYNTSNEAQYVVCQNYVIGKDEGDKYLMLERMQRAAQGMCGQTTNNEGEDSGIEAGCSSSPCPSAGESSPGYSIYNSPGFMTTNEIEMEVDCEIIKIEESQVIPDPVRHAQTQKIVKPKETDTVSFAGLAEKTKGEVKDEAGKEADKSVDLKSPGKAEDIVIVSEEPCPAPQVKFERPNERTDSSSSCGSALRLDSNYTHNGSPASDADSMCSSSDISSVTSPPDMFSFETKDQKTLPVIEDEGDENMDESMIKDLLEITKDDYKKDSNGKEKGQAGSDYTNVLFTVTSPQDFPNSQSPEVKAVPMDSPLSTCTQDTGVRTPGSPDSFGAFLNSPVSPTRQFLDSELSDIVDKLGSEDMEDPADLFSSLLGNNSSPFTLSSNVPTAKVTTVVSGDSTKGIPPGILETTIHRLDTVQKGNSAAASAADSDSDVLPDELAEFSMEFCDKLVDQMAESAMSQWGGENMDVTEMPELPSNMMTWFNRVMATPPANACLLNSSAQSGEADKPLLLNSNGQVYVPPGEAPEDEDDTPIQEKCPTLFKHLTAQSAMEQNNKRQQEAQLQQQQPQQAWQGMMPASSQQVTQQVTEEISKLEIKDEQKTPLLRALLTGDQANPLANERQQPGMGEVVGGSLTPMESQITDTILDMERNTGEVGPNTNVPVLQFENNNIAQQTDLLLLQEQQRQRYLLEQQQKVQQKRLMEEQNLEIERTKQKQQKQLLLQQLLQQRLIEKQLEEEEQNLLIEQQQEQLKEQQLMHLKEKRQLLQQQLHERRRALLQQQQHQEQHQQQQQFIYQQLPQQQTQYTPQPPCTTSQNQLPPLKNNSNSLLQQFLEQPSQIIPPGGGVQGVAEKPLFSQPVGAMQQQQQQTAVGSANHHFLKGQNAVPQQLNGNHSSQFGNSLQHLQQQQHPQMSQQQKWQQGLQQQVKQQTQQVANQMGFKSNQQCQEQQQQQLFQYANYEKPCQQQQQYPPRLSHQGPLEAEEQLPAHLSQQIVDYNQHIQETPVHWQRQTQAMYNGNQ